MDRGFYGRREWLTSGRDIVNAKVGRGGCDQAETEAGLKKQIDNSLSHSTYDTLSVHEVLYQLIVQVDRQRCR